MKINRILLSDTWFLNRNETLFLTIVLLHYNGLINDESLKGLFRNLRNKTLDRRVNTYHCKINDQWYNDETMFNILSEVLNDSYITKPEIDITEFIKYVQQYLSKNKNYCLDYIYYQFVKPYINNYGNSNILKYILSFKINMDVNSIDYEPTGCYCCEDCDGLYSDYKRSNYNFNVVRENKKIIETSIKKYFDSIRNKRY